MYRNINAAAKGGLDAQQIMFTASSFAELLANPQVMGFDQVDKLYAHRRVHQHRSCHKDVLEVLHSWWGDDCLAFVQARLVNDVRTLDDITTRTIVRVKSTMQKAQETMRVKQLDWRTVDPGAQHLFTGSFQPIFEVGRLRVRFLRGRPCAEFGWQKAASQWYPATCYEPTYIFLRPALAAVMVQLRRQSPAWQRLPGDLWRMLMGRYIVPAVAMDAFGGVLQDVEVLRAEAAAEAMGEDGTAGTMTAAYRDVDPAHVALFNSVRWF